MEPQAAFGDAWVWLGAMGRATDRAAVGTAGTGHRCLPLSRDEAGKPPGEIMLRGLIHGRKPTPRPSRTHGRKGTLVDDNYAEDVHDPVEVGRLGTTRVSDKRWKLMGAAPLIPPSTPVRSG
jgi:hypothetical protein